MQKYINILPFIQFLRKSGLEISIDETIVCQKIIDSGFFNTSAVRLKYALKSILIRRFNDHEIFETCFDIFFLKNSNFFKNQSDPKIFDKTDKEILGKIDNNLNSIEKSADNENPNEIFEIYGEHRSDIQGESRTDTNSSIGGGMSDEAPISPLIQSYMRWLPQELSTIAHTILTKTENHWQTQLNSFVDIIFGFGQYKHVQTIAQRFNRYSNHFLKAYSQLLEELQANDTLTIQIKILNNWNLLEKKF